MAALQIQGIEKIQKIASGDKDQHLRIARELLPGVLTVYMLEVLYGMCIGSGVIFSVKRRKISPDDFSTYM